MLRKDERGSSLERIIRRISGEVIYEGTPVPIPNTAVKLVIADNSKGMPLVKIGICQIFLCLKIYRYAHSITCTM